MTDYNELGEQLAAAIDDPGPVPGTGAGLVRYVGGNDELTRTLSGLGHYPRKSEYSDAMALREAQTRWNSTRRRTQRYVAGEGRQQRGATRVYLSTQQRARVRAAATDRKWAGLLHRGAHARMKARIRIESPGGHTDVRVREMPAGGPGQLITAARMGGILSALRDDDAGEAAARFWDAFNNDPKHGYNLPDDAELDEIFWIKLWEQGTNEPA